MILWIVSLLTAFLYILFFLYTTNMPLINVLFGFVLFFILLKVKIKLRYKFIIYLMGMWLLSGILGMGQILLFFLFLLWTAFILSGASIFGPLFPIGIFLFEIISEIKGWEIVWWKRFLMGGAWGIISMFLSLLLFYVFELPMFLGFEHIQRFLRRRS